MNKGKQIERIADAVFHNQSDKRYIPRHNGKGMYSWDVWDCVEERWIEGDDVLAIDPTEPRKKN